MIYREEYINHIISHLMKVPLIGYDHMKLVKDTIRVLKENHPSYNKISDVKLINISETLENTWNKYDKYMSYEKFVVYSRDKNINIILK